MSKIHKEDTVVVIAGKDKGKEGRVLEIVKDKKTGAPKKVVVEGIAFATHHTRCSKTKVVKALLVASRLKRQRLLSLTLR